MKRKRRYPGLRETKGKWKYRFMVDHVTYARVTGLEATAVNAMAALRQREEHRQMVILGKPVAKRVRFNEAVERFLAWSKQEHRDKPNTWRRQKTSLSSLKAMLSTFYMDTLHAGAVDDYKAWRREQGVREVTLRHDLHALSQVCQYADRQGWMEGNPVRLVKMPSDRDSRNERVLTNEEERTYFEAARGLVAGDVGRLILLQGMRPDEVLSTIKDSIDLAVGSLVVEQSKTRAGRRTLDLTAESRTILGRRMRWASPWVFPGAISTRKLTGTGDYEKVKGRRGQVYGSHERHYGYSSYISAHNRICKKCGVSFDPYSLRHTFATRFYEHTRDVFALQKVLGHSDLKTLQRYVHVDEEHVREAMRKYEAGLVPVVEEVVQ